MTSRSSAMTSRGAGPTPAALQGDWPTLADDGL